MVGRDGSVVAGVLGVLAVVVIWRWADAVLWALGWPRRYLRARGYEHELARHTARALLEELERPATYATVTIPRAEVSGEPPWPVIDGPEWDALPEWAHPYADRSSAHGLNSGSSGSDYHGGELPTAGEGGARRPMGMGTRAAGEPGSELYGAPVPAHPTVTLSYGELELPVTERDAAIAETWARLSEAWASEGSAGIPQPARDPNSGAVERGREGDGATGTATRELAAWAPESARQAHPGPLDASSPAPGWAPSKLGTRFDVELAAECARYVREQDADVTDYLERLLGVTW